jgi:hypothetical protein
MVFHFFKPFGALFLGTFFFVLNSPLCVAVESSENTEIIEVRSKRLEGFDEVFFSPEKVGIEKPASDVQLGETLSKLPGVLVRNASGFASNTTVLTAPSLGSAGSSVSVDEIPILDPAGGGLNYSLFPSPLIEKLEYRSVFFAAERIDSDTLSLSGGRIHLSTLDPQKAKPVFGALLLGSANTGQASLGGSLKKGKWSALASVSGFSSRGNFRYKEEGDQGVKQRANNSAEGGSFLAKTKYAYKKEASLELFDFFSHTARVNPGSVDYPTRDGQFDTFNLASVKWRDQNFFNSSRGRSGLSSKVAFMNLRRILKQAPNQSSDNKNHGGYAQVAFHRKTKNHAFSLSLDHQHLQLSNNLGLFRQEITGFTEVTQFDLGVVRLVPLLRYEMSSIYPEAADFITSVQREFGSETGSEHQIALSYGYLHAFPDLISRAGFQDSGFVLLSNLNLKVQRDSIVKATYLYRDRHYSFGLSPFYSFIRNRATLTLATPTAYQMVSAEKVSIVGSTADVQVFLLKDKLALRNSSTLARAWNRNTGAEMPFKPRLEGWASVAVSPTNTFTFSLQEQYLGSRKVSVTEPSYRLSPYYQTHLRIDIRSGVGEFFFKINNVFEKSGFETPGFPFQGRSYWVGYTL